MKARDLARQLGVSFNWLADAAKELKIYKKRIRPDTDIDSSKTRLIVGYFQQETTGGRIAGGHSTQSMESVAKGLGLAPVTPNARTPATPIQSSFAPPDPATPAAHRGGFRVHELAKILDVKSQYLLDSLKQNNINVKNSIFAFVEDNEILKFLESRGHSWRDLPQLEPLRTVAEKKEALARMIADAENSIPEPLISVLFGGSNFDQDDVELVLSYISESYRELGGAGIKVVDGMCLDPSYEGVLS